LLFSAVISLHFSKKTAWLYL